MFGVLGEVLGKSAIAVAIVGGIFLPFVLTHLYVYTQQKRRHKGTLTAAVMSTASSVCGHSALASTSASLATSQSVQPALVKSRTRGSPGSAVYTMPLTLCDEQSRTAERYAAARGADSSAGSKIIGNSAFDMC